MVCRNAANLKYMYEAFFNLHPLNQIRVLFVNLFLSQKKVMNPSCSQNAFIQSVTYEIEILIVLDFSVYTL